MIEDMNPCFFTWDLWRAGNLATFGLATRYYSITSPEGKRILRKHAVGYCNGNNVMCRQKPNTVAVMFFKDEVHFWNHITQREFNEVFYEKK